MKKSEPRKNTNLKKEKNSPPARKEQTAEVGGPKGPEPTRYGDWERKGRCIDF